MPSTRAGGASGRPVLTSEIPSAASTPTHAGEDYPLLVIVGPTASGKSALAVTLAQRLGGEIVSCDSVALYRGLDIGSAKPSIAERGGIPHHALDLLNPDQPTTAGDYARAARASLAGIRERGALPIVVGGTGLYLRALLDGLAPAPARDEVLRERLRGFAARRGPAALHRLLGWLDPQANRLIHPNDTPKLVRSIEVTLLARRPQSAQWEVGRDPLHGFRTLQLGLNPPRAALYERINERAASMFRQGLLEETATAMARFGSGARALGSLGYAEAAAVLQGTQSLPEAIATAQRGHRHYAKRQLTWFRRDARLHWLLGFGDEATMQKEALSLIQRHLMAGVRNREELNR